MEKASRKLLFFITFWLVATGFYLMDGIAEARSSTPGPHTCTADKDCQPYCSFFNAGTGVCVKNLCNCHKNSNTLMHEENKDSTIEKAQITT
ncbi:hypothetical protein P3S67_029481 [Capsicum chacoense]